MKLTSPLTPEQIREGMAEVIEKIQEETKWDLQRTLSDVSISFGETTEYGPDFGTVRKKDSIVFGSWVNDVTPRKTWFNLCEFLIVRETFSLFFEDSLLFNGLTKLTNYFLNLSATSYLRKEYEKKALEIKLAIAVSRFRFIKKDILAEERRLLNKLNELFSIIVSQTISFKLLTNTYSHFIEDVPINEIDFEEALDYVIRYLSNSIEEIISPIRVRHRTLKVLEKVAEFGFSGSTQQIADSLGINSVTISRELNQIANRYNAKFRVEKNFYKLGLHYHLIIIRLNNNSEKAYSNLITELKKVRYIYEIYDGKNKDKKYLYSITLCPLVVAEQFGVKLEKLQKAMQIESFEIKPIRNRISKTTLIDNDFKPSIENFRKLMENEISCLKLTTWTNDNFVSDSPIKFNAKDKNILRFLSIYQSNGIVNYNNYGLFQAELIELLKDNDFDPKNQQECLNFMNSLRNNLLNQNLIDFRLQLTTTSMTANDMLILKIRCDPAEQNIHSLLEKFRIFCWTLTHIGFEDVIFSIHGLNYLHPVSEMIINEIKNNGFEVEYFSVKLNMWRYVALDQLYSYPDKKWFLR